ncbi:MAG: transglutaminase family protein [Bryobacteraceae bacterium]
MTPRCTASRQVRKSGSRDGKTACTQPIGAESRRLARFQNTGHTPGTMAVPPEERNPEFSLTLDLRRKQDRRTKWILT